MADSPRSAVARAPNPGPPAAALLRFASACAEYRTIIKAVRSTLLYSAEICRTSRDTVRETRRLLRRAAMLRRRSRSH